MQWSFGWTFLSRLFSTGCLEIELAFESVNLCLLFVSVEPFVGAACLVVEHYQIAPAHVETREMFTGSLRIVDILVHDERSSARVSRVASRSDKIG